ncbi:acylphosphatase [Candidatus Falkowbacteria bacterium]|nr:acylphosphatase [Candidatus Falkowbacteria bacterium]
MLKAVKIRITGAVQGVSFRQSILERAEANSITGWVKNTPDGAVEAMAEGEEGALTKLLDYCQSGPSGARVQAVETQWLHQPPQCGEFIIIYD